MSSPPPPPTALFPPFPHTYCFRMCPAHLMFPALFIVSLAKVLLLSLSGDEVVEWNGRSLQGATFEEVYDIILESKQEPQVELIVHRSVK